MIALRQLPLHQIDVAAVFADVNDDDVRAHGGSELQIADSEAITSTVLLREMHAQMHHGSKNGGVGAPPLTIVTQVVDVLTQRLLVQEPTLLEPAPATCPRRRLRGADGEGAHATEGGDHRAAAQPARTAALSVAAMRASWSAIRLLLSRAQAARSPHSAQRLA